MANESEPTLTPAPEAADVAPMELDELVKHWAAVRLGHEAVMLDKLPKVNQYQFDAAEFARTGKWPARPDDEDMGVSIGNREIHYHPAPPAPVAAPATAKGSGAVKAAAMVAALAGAGGLGAAGAAAVMSALDKSPVIVEQPQHDHTDTDTQYELRISSSP
jgi:hypothetical protein